MADLMLKVGAGAGYESGDILHAFSSRRITSAHVQHLCALPDDARRIRHDPDSLARHLREQTHAYMFRRISRTAVERVTRTTQQVEVCDDTPRLIDGVMQSINVENYIQQRLLHLAHVIFGSPGQEIWFGGRIDFSAGNLSKVWDIIEARTPRRRADPEFQVWPAGRLDLQSHLMLSLDADLSEADVEDLEAMELDADSNVVQKRLNNVPLDARLGITAAQMARVRDPLQSIDLRAERPPLPLAALRIVKPFRSPARRRSNNPNVNS